MTSPTERPSSPRRSSPRGIEVVEVTVCGSSLTYTYYIDAAGVHHPATLAGTPWALDGRPIPEPDDVGWRAEIGHRLPDAEHGVEWGADVVVDDDDD